MVQLKEHNTAIALQEKVQQLEKLLVKTKEELKQTNEYNKELESILQEAVPAKKSKIITIKSATKIEFVQVNDIVSCQADEVYTNIQLIDGRIITAAKPLNTFENILADHFFRISKSHLININHIVTFHKNRNEILMQGNLILTVARRRRIEFLKSLK
ncbi:MAG: hypothetical protein A3K10_17275 [Bacteroidetes bacterium RIFCSPLOWO2_12_FULL_31_6]|nr:MAG: hypothetical protein A3K10_17275 [Bacteroidetes bacterium RIFCSPLOWO2_12_FULL_31_6]